MNMLLDELPTSVVIDGIQYDLNFDFRYSVMFEMLMFDDEIGDTDKLKKALKLYYGDHIPRTSIRPPIKSCGFIGVVRKKPRKRDEENEADPVSVIMTSIMMMRTYILLSSNNSV